VQGLLWTGGLAEKPAPPNAGPRPANLPREGDYVFSFDGQVGEPVAFVALDGQSTFVGKGRGERGGDTEKVKMLHPGVANAWNLTAAAHIVDLEVSRRRGRAALPPGSTSNLTASKVRVHDERAFAGSVGAVISWAARDFEGLEATPLVSSPDGDMESGRPRGGGGPIAHLRALVQARQHELAVAQRLRGGEPPVGGAEHALEQRVSRLVGCHLLAQQAGNIDVDSVAGEAG
jgi:hypothetical protein